MITSNAMQGGSPDGFRHMGLVHTHLTGAARSRGNYGKLQSELVPQMDALAVERKIMTDDRDRISQALFLVLRGCQSAQDVRDALPNSLKDLMPQLKGLERTRPEAFTLADNPRSYTQYMKLREKIDFYVAARLLY
jgi:hypothetical protein